MEQTLSVPTKKAQLAKKRLDAEQSDPDRLPNRPDSISWRLLSAAIVSMLFFIHYCNVSGIKTFRNTPLSPDELRRNLVNKKEVYLLDPKNSSVIQANTIIFMELLQNSGNLYVLITSNDSKFCRDVATIESDPSIYRSTEEVKREENRFHSALSF